jgi:hypothetical protein
LIAGPSVPCCGTGAWTFTEGARREVVAIVKFNTEDEVVVRVVRDGTMNVLVCTEKVCEATWKEVSVSGLEMGMLKG